MKASIPPNNRNYSEVTGAPPAVPPAPRSQPPLGVPAGYLEAMAQVFLSYNAADRPLATELAGGLYLLGADVWFDQWKVVPGDSIPAAVNAGISSADTFCLVWSVRAKQSRWVSTELDAAITRVIHHGARIVPVVLDAEPLPVLIASIRHVVSAGRPPFEVAQEVLGLHTPAQVRLAVQGVLDKAGMRFEEYWGVGLLVGCPKCGAGLDSIRGYQSDDDEHDRRYAGAECRACGWSEGSEL